MTVDTTPLKGTIQAWRDLNAERASLLGETLDDEGQLSPTPEQHDKLKELDSQELFRLRDIAGEAMQLVDEINLFAQASLAENAAGQPLVAVKVSGN